MNVKTGLKIFLPLLGACALLAGTFIASNAVELFGNDKSPASEIGAKFESGKAAAIAPDLAEITKDAVADWIREQGEEQNDYYFDGLFVEEVNLDQDEELEVLARIDGGVHLGDFFIFDQQTDGSYKLIFEQPWHVLSWDAEYFRADQMNPLFTIITRTGGTGMDVREAHLMYMNETGVWTEAWTGTLKNRSSFQDNYYIVMGSYQFNDDNGELYYWQTESNAFIEKDMLVDEPKTTLQIFELQQGRFIEKK